jgi:hypothetical protein
MMWPPFFAQDETFPALKGHDYNSAQTCFQKRAQLQSPATMECRRLTIYEVVTDGLATTQAQPRKKNEQRTSLIATAYVAGCLSAPGRGLPES